MFDDRDDIGAFNHGWYRAHTAARQYHLASLGLPLKNRTVLELGAGIGDHTAFFMNRGCEVTVTDGRPENVEVLQDRGYDARILDVESPGEVSGTWDVVYCYGLLYHLAKPYAALRTMAAWCSDLFLLETTVSQTLDDGIRDEADHRTASVHGRICDPVVSRVVDSLKAEFPFVYRSRTHPLGMAFDVPIDWVDPRGECRAVFVASRSPITLQTLVIQ